MLQVVLDITSQPLPMSTCLAELVSNSLHHLPPAPTSLIRHQHKSQNACRRRVLSPSPSTFILFANSNNGKQCDFLESCCHFWCDRCRLRGLWSSRSQEADCRPRETSELGNCCPVPGNISLRYFSRHMLILALPKLIHSVALLMASGNPVAASLFTAGMTMFSGSIYALTLNPEKFKFLGPATPIGGVCLIAGWLVLAFGKRGSPPRFPRF